MSSIPVSEKRITMIRAACALFAISSFLLGGWMMLDPAGYWEGLGIGGNPFVQAIYGGAIWGEGTMFALGVLRPLRYAVFFQYLVVYKTMACLAGLTVLLRMEPSAPTGAWIVLGAWAGAGILSAIVFPWRSWREAGDTFTNLEAEGAPTR